MTKEEVKDELKNRISLALKDPILQQGFEIICKNLAELEKENARLTTNEKSLIAERKIIVKENAELEEEEKHEWEKFRESGLLWFINSILHLFGYAVTFEYEQEQLVSVMPKRVCFRGFKESTNTEGYERVTKYLNKEIQTLLGDLDK